jgi:Uncharacterized protein family UPF0016
MMLANAPAVWAGKALVGRINMKKTRRLAAALFLLMGCMVACGRSNISLRFIVARHGMRPQCLRYFRDLFRTTNSVNITFELMNYELLTGNRILH